MVGTYMTILNGNMSSQIFRKRKIRINYFVTENLFYESKFLFSTDNGN